MVRRARAGGFTLIELMVASVVALMVLSTAIALLLASARAHRRHVELGRLKRSAALVVDQLTSELRQAGLGVPSSVRAEPPGGLYPPPLFTAGETSIAFSADLPRPDSALNGLSELADDQSPGTLPAHGLAVVNELSGGCDVYVGALPCTTDASSLLFPTEPGSGCDGSPDARTCPWALNRYRAREAILIVNSNGNWVQRELDSPPFGASNTRRALKLTTAPPPQFPFFAGANRGFVSTPDRVFYRVDGDSVVRKQCWDAVPIPTTTDALTVPCSRLDDGTDWEPLATGATLSFIYYDANGIPLGPLPLSEPQLRRVRRVEVQLHLERAVSGLPAPLAYDTAVAVSLQP